MPQTFSRIDDTDERSRLVSQLRAAGYMGPVPREIVAARALYREVMSVGDDIRLR